MRYVYGRALEKVLGSFLTISDLRWEIDTRSSSSMMWCGDRIFKEFFQMCISHAKDAFMA